MNFTAEILPGEIRGAARVVEKAMELLGPIFESPSTMEEVEIPTPTLDAIRTQTEEKPPVTAPVTRNVEEEMLLMLVPALVTITSEPMRELPPSVSKMVVPMALDREVELSFRFWKLKLLTMRWTPLIQFVGLLSSRWMYQSRIILNYLPLNPRGLFRRRAWFL